MKLKASCKSGGLINQVVSCSHALLFYLPCIILYNYLICAAVTI